MLEVLFSELVAVDDQRATLFQIGKIKFQRGWIHGYQNVWLITWCPNVMTGKIQLKAAHAGKTAGRGANFSRKIRQGRNVVADDCRSVGELRPSQLHTVAGIAGEANRNRIEFFQMLVDGFDRWFENSAHSSWIISFELIFLIAHCRLPNQIGNRQSKI